MLRLAALALAAAALAGCDSDCLDLQQVMCECIGRTQDQRNSCSDDAKAQEKLAPPSDAQLAECTSLLPKCEELLGTTCAALDTEEGKKACGLAR